MTISSADPAPPGQAVHRASAQPTGACELAQIPLAAATKKRHTKGLKRQASSASLSLEAAQQADQGASNNTAQVQSGKGLRQSSPAAAAHTQLGEEEVGSVPQQVEPEGHVQPEQAVLSQQGGEAVVEAPLVEAL